MAYQLVYTESYLKIAARFLKRHPQVKTQYAKTLALLAANPHHLNELKGKNLACFCPLDASCHADVLLELANPTKP